MAGYFVDTSALAKLYHQEPGSDYVERILEQPGSRGVISRLALVEMESVFAIKERTGVPSVEGRSTGRRRIRADIARERLFVGPPVEDKRFQSAARLLRTHGVTLGLRTLDSLQLAIALDLHRAGSISMILSADHRLCAVAEVCGCPAMNPAYPV